MAPERLPDQPSGQYGGPPVHQECKGQPPVLAAPPACHRRSMPAWSSLGKLVPQLAFPEWPAVACRWLRHWHADGTAVAGELGQAAALSMTLTWPRSMTTAAPSAARLGDKGTPAATCRTCPV